MIYGRGSPGADEGRVSSSHYPQGDGQVERMNRDVVDSLTRTATDNELWDLEVQRTAWSIRISPSRRTNWFVAL